MKKDFAICFRVDEQEKAFIERVAKEQHMNPAEFAREATREKALGRKPDSVTGEIIQEIQELRTLIAKRQLESTKVEGIMDKAREATIGGIPEDQVRDKILTILSASPGLTQSELARAIGYPESITMIVASRMCDVGTITFDTVAFEYRMKK